MGWRMFNIDVTIMIRSFIGLKYPFAIDDYIIKALIGELYIIYSV
jgi:hypothetical protein